MQFLHAQILAGPEIGRRNDTIKNIKANLTKIWGQAPEEHRFWAGNTPVGDLISLLMNGSLFSSGRLVICDSADLFKNKSDILILSNWIKKPSENTVLLLITDNFNLDKTIEDAVGKSGKQIFWELFENEKKQWIIDFFRKEDINLEPEACQTILETMENNTETLKSECSKLVLFVKRGGTITSEDVENYITRSHLEDPFTLFEYMAHGNLERSLDALDTILSSKENNAVSILGGLTWSFRRLLEIHVSITSGQSFEEAARRHRVTSRKLLNIYERAYQRWSEKQCKAVISFSVDIDLNLRSMGTQFHKILLELFIYTSIIRKYPTPLSAKKNKTNLLASIGGTGYSR